MVINHSRRIVITGFKGRSIVDQRFDRRSGLTSAQKASVIFIVRASSSGNGHNITRPVVDTDSSPLKRVFPVLRNVGKLRQRFIYPGLKLCLKRAVEAGMNLKTTVAYQIALLLIRFLIALLIVIIGSLIG